MFETYTPQQLRDAIEIELQHDENPKTAAITAMKRLKEDPEYYVKKYGVLAMSKARIVKYIRRAPDGKGGWKYFYKESGKKESKPEEKKVPQTETKEFKAWFGDSKVVDKSGKPLVVYHGTHGDFKEFKPNESLGGLIFLSESAKEAGAFASVRGANIIPVYLKAEKVWPKVVHASDEVRIAKKAKKLGYDAIRVRDDVRGEINWAVFSPTQIKSATGNRGTFDPNEADMTKASGAMRQGHKYIKRIPKASGKGFHYFYTKQELRDFEDKEKRKIPVGESRKPKGKISRIGNIIVDETGREVDLVNGRWEYKKIKKETSENFPQKENITKRGNSFYDITNDKEVERDGDNFRYKNDEDRIRPKTSKLKVKTIENSTNLKYKKEWESKNKLSLVGQTVDGFTDLAYLAQIYRNPQYETFHVIMVDNSGEIVHQTGMTSRLPGVVQVGVDPGDISSTIKILKEAMEKSGASGYYLLHNHPSGRPVPSNEDRSLTALFSVKLDGLIGHVVIDHNQASAISPPDFNYGIFDLEKIKENNDKYKKEINEKMTISGPQDVMTLGKKYQDENDKYCVLIGYSHSVRGIAKIPKEYFNGDGERGIKAVNDFGRNCGATSNFIAGLDMSHIKSIREMTSKGYVRDVAIKIDADKYVSSTESGYSSYNENISYGINVNEMKPELLKYKDEDMTKASEKAGHKYYKRVPKPTGKGYYYFYTQKEFKDYQKEQIKPEEKTGKFNLLTTIKGLFGFSDERQAKEKIKDDYKKNAIGERFSISLDSWASHLSEYFRNKDKWAAFFSKKKEEKEKSAADKKKPGEKKEKADRPKSIIKLSLMKAIHEMYGSVKPVPAQEEIAVESDYTQWLKNQPGVNEEIKTIQAMANLIKDPKNRKKYIQREKHDFDTRWTDKFSKRNNFDTMPEGFFAQDEDHKYYNYEGNVYKINKSEIIEGVEGVSFGDQTPVPMDQFMKDNFETMPEDEQEITLDTPVKKKIGSSTKRGQGIQEAVGRITQNVIDYIERGVISIDTFLSGWNLAEHVDKDLGKYVSNPIVFNAVVAAVKKKYFPTTEQLAEQVKAIDETAVKRNVEMVVDTGNGSKIEKNKKETPKQTKESADNEEIAAREGYFNEKPAEILNVGQDVWGAARHNFDTYERVNVNINQMETDGTAAAYVTKKNLFGDYGLANKDERVSKGETEYKVLASYALREYLAKMPGDNEESRQKYMEFCRAIVRLDQETTTAKAFLVGLSEVYGNLFPMPEQTSADKYSGKKFNKQAPETIGTHIHLLMTALQGEPDRVALYRLDKKEKREFESIGKIVSGETDKRYSYDEIKEGMFGKVKAAGIKVKKGDNVVFTEAWKDAVKMVKSSFPTPEDESEYKRINENISELYSFETALEYGAFINGTPPEAGERYNVSMLMQDSSGKTKLFRDNVTIESVKNGWVNYKIEGKETGGMSLGAFLRDLQRTNIQPLQINKGRKKDVVGELNKRFGTNFIKEQDAKDYIKGQISSSQEEAKTHIVRNVYYPEEKGQIVKAGKDKVYVSFKFPDGTIKTFNVPPEMIKQENIESVKRESERKGTRKLDLFIESRVERIGGKDFSKLSVDKAQEVLKNDFKLKSVQYGNSMPDTERQYHTQWAAQSFSDLSDILKIPMQQITVNGKLGIAFGARGNVTAFSGALAHYEPGSKMINITRSNGVGTLAHEWGHFLDNALSEDMRDYVSSTPRYVEKEVGSNEIKHGSIYEVERRSKRGSALRVERYFYDSNAKNKSYPFVKMNEGQSDIGPDPHYVGFYWFNNGKKEKVKEPVSIPFMDKAREIAKRSVESLQAQVREEIDKIPKDETDKEKIAIYGEVKQDLLDLLKDTYLNSNNEAFARAFETYVADKLENNGRKNTYLASKQKTGEKDGRLVYPQGKFRDSIGKMFDEFFDMIRGSEDLKKAIVRATGKMFIFRRK